MVASYHLSLSLWTAEALRLAPAGQSVLQLPWPPAKLKSALRPNVSATQPR